LTGKQANVFLIKSTAGVLLSFLCAVSLPAQSSYNEAEGVIYTECEGDVSETVEQKIEKQLRKLQKNVPLDYNSFVQNYINVYTLRKKATAEKCLGRSKQYFPVFEEAFAKYGVPQELKYLSVIESALNPLAISKKGATGIFQFMYSTAKLYGLVINKFVDERRDPYLSAEAAAKYLQNAYARYGNWLHVIASYNCGAGNVDRAIKKAGGSSNFWDIYPFLPAETRGYVPAYIATVYVMGYYKELGLNIQYPEGPPVKTVRVPVQEKITLNHLESRLHLPVKQLKTYNPSLLGNAVPAGFLFTLPEELLVMYTEQEDTIYALAKGNFKPSPYKDSLTAMVPAQKEVPAENKDNLLKKIFKKDKKATPPKKATAKFTPPVEATISSDEPAKFFPGDSALEILIYSVKPGDNMGYIAGWFHCTVKDIKKWNGLRGNQLSIGQELLLYVYKEDYSQYARFEYLSKRLKNKLCKRLPSRKDVKENSRNTAMNHAPTDHYGPASDEKKQQNDPAFFPYSLTAMLTQLPKTGSPEV